MSKSGLCASIRFYIFDLVEFAPSLDGIAQHNFEAYDIDDLAKIHDLFRAVSSRVGYRMDAGLPAVSDRFVNTIVERFS